MTDRRSFATAVRARVVAVLPRPDQAAGDAVAGCPTTASVSCATSNRVAIGADEAREVFEATPILSESSRQAFRRALAWLAEDDQEEERP